MQTPLAHCPHFPIYRTQRRRWVAPLAFAHRPNEGGNGEAVNAVAAQRHDPKPHDSTRLQHSEESHPPPDPEPADESGSRARLIAVLSIVGGLAALVAGGVLLKDQIKAFLETFICLVDDWGPLGYVAYILVYAGLELLAVPAIPLTMTAGVIFGVGAGTAVVSIASTLAATGAFLIARYVARERFASWARRNPKFVAIDKAIGKEGFRVVALLRLSPLLPLAASNYLYGLTSVDLWSYVAASWAGMLPGTFAYVAAGTYGKELVLGGHGFSHGGMELWQVAVGLGVTALAVWYVGSVAKKALTDIENGTDDS